MKTRLERFSNMLKNHGFKIVGTGKGGMKRGDTMESVTLQSALNAGADDIVEGWRMVRRDENYSITGKVGEEAVDVDVLWVMTSRGPVKLK